MRIVHIEAGRHLYGGAAQVRYLVEGLARSGAENVVVCAEDGTLAEDPPQARIVALPMRGDLDVALLPRLVRVLRQLAPDLVHVHSRRGADLFGGAAAAHLGVPAVLSRRVDSVEPRWLARLKYRCYDAVVVLSAAIERQVRACGVAPAGIARIPSAVDTRRFAPDAAAQARLRAAFGLAQRGPVIGVVAQLIARKGHAALLAVLPELLRVHPDLHVVCFGRGPLERALREELVARDLGAHVTLAGFRTDLPALLPGLDVLAHPAEREGLGLALLEAASAGVPVVACAAGGVPDAVLHERTGLLVSVGDGDALRAALLRLLGDAPLRARLGAAARAHVERHHTLAGLAAKHEALYRRVLEARAAARPAAVSR